MLDVELDKYFTPRALVACLNEFLLYRDHAFFNVVLAMFIAISFVVSLMFREHEIPKFCTRENEILR